MFKADVRAPTSGMVETYRRNAIQTFENAAMRTVRRVSTRGKGDIRAAMRNAGLGRLGNAIDSSPDNKVIRFGAEGFSTSARFFIRSRSERTLGAIKAYTEGADIAPVRSRWLWIPTDEIQRLAGSNRQGQGQRLTPGLWRARGFDTKVGPLVRIKSINGYPLLIVRNVGVSASGARRSARSLTKKGMARKGQVRRDMIVAFVGIPRTSRAARVNITQILNSVRAQMPDIFTEELAKERR